MWRLAISELSRKTVYKGQKLIFIGSIKARVKTVYVQGKKVPAAYYGSDTKPVFRSESARHVLFLQMSKEMWEFDSDGSGEIMFNKVINGFLPELFKRWVDMRARHLVSIVLFTRVYRDYEIAGFSALGVSSDGSDGRQGSRFQDYYRVVVSETANLQWATILDQLKQEFRIFWRDISLHSSCGMSTGTMQDLVERDPGASTNAQGLALAKPSSALKGNVLEAINLASTQFSEDYVDRDLVRTGLSVVIVTPGTGFFEVDYDVLRWTTESLTNDGIGVDLVCLSRMPLHSVPLFKYRNPSHFANEEETSKTSENEASSRLSKSEVKTPIGQLDKSPLSILSGALNDSMKPLETESHVEGWIYAVPTWIDVSYWTGTAQSKINHGKAEGNHQYAALSHAEQLIGFTPRAKMYELQMMGIMENEMSNISLPHLHQSMYLFRPQEGRMPKDKNIMGSASDTKRVATASDEGRVGSQGTFKEVSSVFAKFGRDRLQSKEERKRCEWMDDYDEQVFRPLSQLPESEAKAIDQRVHAKESTKLDDGGLAFGTSFDARTKSPPGDYATTGKAFFDRKMKERLAEVARASAVEKPVRKSRDFSDVSSRLPYQLGNRRAGRHSVQLKAVASTDVNIEHVTSGSVVSRTQPESRSYLSFLKD